MLTDTITISSPTPTFTLTFAALITLAIFITRKTQPKPGPLPPGPKPRLLIGNALDIPFHNASKQYFEWSKELGSTVIHLEALGNRIVMLNSYEDAEELLETRTRIYCDRPVVPTLDILGWDYNFALYPYGDTWRAHRRISHQVLKPEATHRYHPIQVKKVHDMMLGLLDHPEKFAEHSRMLSISLPLTTMYGYEVRSLDDPAVLAADQGAEIGQRIFAPGGSLVNIFPILKHVPWTWTQKMARESRRLAAEMKRIPLEALLRDMANGTAIPSMIGEFMERKQTVGVTKEEEETILNVANTVYGAAAETTMSATQSTLYLLVTHPHIQAKAQAELGRVLGSPRLPTYEDRGSLPYIESIYREVLRLYPPIPLALPHKSIEDDWYKGYFIPKGTSVSGNIWAINRDPTRYPDPEAFKPERFLEEDGSLNRDDKVLAYGFGRRGCIGKHVASDMLWLTTATLLACFNIRKKLDKEGNEIPIDEGFKEEGFMLMKTPFECDITPRSEVWRGLVEGTRDQGYEF
ncbi:cytochrome P450 [Panaeolus papilionaceus]|nr:cytochrome P450 [Panaeolus papilionaceus]